MCAEYSFTVSLVQGPRTPQLGHRETITIPCAGQIPDEQSTERYCKQVMWKWCKQWKSLSEGHMIS